MTRENYELHRTDSLCPNPMYRLLDLVKTNRSSEIRKLVNEEGKELLSQFYDHPYYKTIVQIACSNLAFQVTPTTLKILIDLGADLYISNEQFDNKQCLHFAAESGNPEILEVVLKNIDKSNINAICDGGNNALHCLIKFCERDEVNDQAECVKLLVENKSFDVNQTDEKNLTAIFHAARKGKREIVSTILNYSQNVVDIDSHKFRGKSARDFIQDKRLYDDILPLADDTRHGNNFDSVSILFSYLRDSKEDEFIRSGHLTQSTVNEDDGNMSLLQFAASKGLTKAVGKLLELGASPNKTTEKTPNTPIEIATSEGYYEILQLLLPFISVVPPKAVATALKMADVDSVDTKRDYQICCKLLLEQPLDINCIEDESFLHYAVRYGGPEMTLTLLRAGASLAHKDRQGVMPIEDIDSNTMEKHLDECLEANLEKSVETENFEAFFNYKTLMPPKKSENKTQVKEDSSSTPEDLEAASNFIKRQLEEFTSETEVVSFMSESSELRHLLKHPVITSFLYLKWFRLSRFFYTNLAFYLSFCFSLLLYVFINYNVDEPDKSTPSMTLTILLSILFTILLFRELFQMVLSPQTYFLSFENWIEIVLVFVTALILFQKSPSESVRKQASALVILLAAFEVVLLVGQHPKMATNIVMLRTVSYNFFKFFMWYAILIIAFALSFHVLFKNDEDGDVNNNNNNSSSSGTVEEKEQDFFLDPGVSLFKTFVMLTGEFDASDIDFQKFPITSHLIFALFIFMIAIILFNLLNGLAVSDTQMIKNNAELVGHIARIQHITYIENMFLGNVLPNSLLKILEEKCCCVKNPLSKFTFLKPFAYRVCLFPHYIHDYKLKIFPNRFGRVVLPEENVAIDDSVDTGCVNDCKYIYLDRKTTKRTRNLIREKKMEMERRQVELENEQKQNDIIYEQKMEIEQIKKEQKIIMDKLDTIINNLNFLNK